MVLWLSFLLRWRSGKDESGLAGCGEGEGGVGAAGSDRDWDVSRPQWHCQVRWCDLAVVIERGLSSPDEGGRTEPWFIKFQPILAFSDIEEHPRRSARLGRDQGKGQGCRGSQILSGRAFHGLCYTKAKTKRAKISLKHVAFTPMKKNRSEKEGRGEVSR
ncbi:hypothetical protein Droror1_Dr00000178 [Drosera rotundifolia]